jgi:peptide/nickel transport system permease protein
MLRFLLFRTIRAVCVLFSVSVLCFIGFELAPGDIFLEARTNPEVSAEAVQALRERRGLDRAWLERYSAWARSVLRGEWGESLSYGIPVWPILKERAKNTLALSVSAMLIAWIFGIGLCVTAASAGRHALSACRWLTSILTSIPDILISIGVLLWIAWTGLLPLGGMSSLSGAVRPSTWYAGSELLRHLIAPVFALSIAALPQILGHGMAAISEASDSAPVHAARSHGIRGGRLMFSYVLRAAANPLLSLFGLSIGTLLSSTLVVESIMAWPGIGRLLLEATLQRDIYVVLGAIILSSAFLLVGNLLADLLLYFADPRIRHA